MRLEHPRAQEFLKDFGRVLEGLTPSNLEWLTRETHPLKVGALPIVATCQILNRRKAIHLVEATFAGYRWGYALEATFTLSGFTTERPLCSVVRYVSMFGDVEALENDLVSALLTV